METDTDTQTLYHHLVETLLIDSKLTHSSSGRPLRIKIQFRKECQFESDHPHHFENRVARISPFDFRFSTRAV